MIFMKFEDSGRVKFEVVPSRRHFENVLLTQMKAPIL